jgi:transcriptional regulator with XRE-family HTH domain
MDARLPVEEFLDKSLTRQERQTVNKQIDAMNRLPDDLPPLEFPRRRWRDFKGPQSIEDYIAEQERLDPEYEREAEEARPLSELARLVLIRRTELGISQQELAERMGTSLSAISRLERGRQNFSVTTLRRLARALDTKLATASKPTTTPTSRQGATSSSFPDSPLDPERGDHAVRGLRGVERELTLAGIVIAESSATWSRP